MAETRANSEIKSYVDRAERLQAQIDSIMDDAREEAKPIKDDLADLFKEAKGNGFDLKPLKAVIRARRVRNKLSNQERDTFDLIRHALGELSDTPLGKAALEAAGNGHATA